MLCTARFHRRQQFTTRAPNRLSQSTSGNRRPSVAVTSSSFGAEKFGHFIVAISVRSSIRPRERWIVPPGCRGVHQQTLHGAIVLRRLTRTRIDFPKPSGASAPIQIKRRPAY